MAKGFSLQAIGVLDGGQQMADGAQVQTHDKSNNTTLTGASLVAQGVGAVGDTIILFDYPGGCTPSTIMFQTDTAMSSTLNFGDGTNATRFGSIVAPAANTRYPLDLVAVRMAGELAAPVRLTITVAVAALPTVFNAKVQQSYFVPAM